MLSDLACWQVLFYVSAAVVLWIFTHDVDRPEP